MPEMETCAAERDSAVERECNQEQEKNVPTGEFEMAIASLQIKLPVFLSVTS
jgi:hypothetical protein